MGGTRAAVAAGIIAAEKEGSGADGALQAIAKGGFEIAGTPYADFIHHYFSS